jgi:hypothetical protein
VWGCDDSHSFACMQVCGWHRAVAHPASAPLLSLLTPTVPVCLLLYMELAHGHPCTECCMEACTRRHQRQGYDFTAQVSHLLGGSTLISVCLCMLDML